MSEVQNETQKPVITVSKVIQLLEDGYTRLTKQETEEGSGRSIQSFYGIKATHVKAIFNLESLKGRKTKGYTRKSTGPKALPFDIVDDVQESVSGETVDSHNMEAVESTAPVNETVEQDDSFM